MVNDNICAYIIQSQGPDLKEKKGLEKSMGLFLGNFEVEPSDERLDLMIRGNHLSDERRNHPRSSYHIYPIGNQEVEGIKTLNKRSRITHAVGEYFRCEYDDPKLGKFSYLVVKKPVDIV